MLCSLAASHAGRRRGRRTGTLRWRRSPPAITTGSARGSISSLSSGDPRAADVLGALQAGKLLCRPGAGAVHQDRRRTRRGGERRAGPGCRRDGAEAGAPQQSGAQRNRGGARRVAAVLARSGAAAGSGRGGIPVARSGVAAGARPGPGEGNRPGGQGATAAGARGVAAVRAGRLGRGPARGDRRAARARRSRRAQPARGCRGGDAAGGGGDRRAATPSPRSTAGCSSGASRRIFITV